MINFSQYISESLAIDLGFVFEANKKICPVVDKSKGTYKYAPMSIMTGDHVEHRKSERKVEDPEIIEAIMGAKDDILKMLKDYLEINNISQKEFALRIGISQKHLIDILSGNKDLTLSLIEAISIVTGISKDYIIEIEFNSKMDQEINNYLKN